MYKLRWSGVVVYGMVLWMGVEVIAKSVQKFKYRSYSEMVDAMIDLNTTYPDFVDLYTAQDKYGLPVSKDLMCEWQDVQQPCLHYILRLTNEAKVSSSTPEVFLSGALHGNERIGPNSVIEVARLLADHAGRRNQTSGNTWLKHLLDTRAIYIMPMTNALGYYKNERGELHVDTNRDYNYMKAPHCMESMTSRAVNELWRDHIFQISLTYHGGMRAISYEWGSPNHYINRHASKSQKSPDHAAQTLIAEAMQHYGGAFSDHKLYPTGMMNELVYGVTGGMEDWAYAASWENQYAPTDSSPPFAPCQPSSFGGYAAEKTVYNNVTHRTFNILIETSNNKEPLEKGLGDSASLQDDQIQAFLGTDKPIGHIPRNIRLALEIIEIVQPYVVWGFSQVVKHALGSDGKPYVVDSGYAKTRGCTGNVIVCRSSTCTAKPNAVVRFEWEVLGSFTVDATNLMMSDTQDFKTLKIESDSQKGFTRRHWNQKMTTMSTGKGPIFVQCLKMPRTSGEMYVRAKARVDQNWKDQGIGNDAPAPHVPPQSHMVNARTNPNWNMKNAGHVVVGQLDWFSDTITIRVGDEDAKSQPEPSKKKEPPSTAKQKPMDAANEPLEKDSKDSASEEPKASQDSSQSPDSNKSQGTKTSQAPVEIAHLASALGYLVVGIGGIIIGAVLATLYFTVFRHSIAYSSLPTDRVAEDLTDDEDITRDIELNDHA